MEIGPFQGHRVFPMGFSIDVVLCLIPLVLIYFFLKASNAEKKNWITITVLGLLWTFFMPNCLYLATAFRYLLIKDTIADELDLWSFVVFGIFSLIGLITALLNTLILSYRLRIKETFHPDLLILAVTILSSIGVVIGWNNINTIDMVLHPENVFWTIWKVTTTPSDWIKITVVFEITYFITLVVHQYFSKRTKKPRLPARPLATSS